MPNKPKIVGNWLMCSCGTQTYLKNKDDYIARCVKCGHFHSMKTTLVIRNLDA